MITKQVITTYSNHSCMELMVLFGKIGELELESHIFLQIFNVSGILQV